MKKVYLIILNLVFWAIISLNETKAQFMVNGGFESVDISIPITPPYNGPIYLAPPWNNITGTCDVHHSSYQQTASIAGVPHTGNGNGRFVSPDAIHGTSSESCYGKTLQLTAGQTYVVSFWIRQDFSSDHDVPVGVIVSENIPNISYVPFASSQSANFKITPTNTQYVFASFCFTASNSVEHFVSFVPWEDASGDQAVGFYIDDVSVDGLAPGSILSSSGLTIPQTIYCVGDNVVLDGSSSINETSYSWEVYKLVNSTGEQFLYSSGQLSGQASSFDASAVINFPEPGACYRVYLTTFNSCDDKTYIDFCYEDPNINFLNGTNYLCEGVPTNLTVTGDNSWTYTWSTGQTGLGSDGFKTIQVTPTGNNATYSVNVVTSLGCTVTESITFNVFSSNNQAPWMNGINGTGEYTIYVNQGDIVNFSSNLFNDNPNEIPISTIPPNNIPSAFSQIIPPSNGNGQTLNFYWNTGFGIAPNVPPGIYQFTVHSSDDNLCGIVEPNDQTFTIVVICDQCPMCVYYEDRGPTPQLPLPSETKAGKCIEAGFSQSVTNGTSDVLFQAGLSIDLGPFFTAEPGFVAQIDPSTCVTDCEDCCTDWTGFSIDEIPNGYYMNFEDSDPTNDIFQITDVNHPFCAFGAKGYELTILNQWGNVMAESSYSTSACCPFSSPAPENQLTHSSIWWDGYTDNIFGNPVHPNDGVYYYLLTLYGCDGVSEVYQGFIHVFSGSGLIVAPNGPTDIPTDQKEKITASIESMNKYMTSINLTPNPSSEEIQIIGIENDDNFSAQLFDEKGQIIDKKLQLKNGRFDVSKLSPGTYFCKILINGNFITKKFVKI